MSRASEAEPSNDAFGRGAGLEREPELFPRNEPKDLNEPCLTPARMMSYHADEWGIGWWWRQHVEQSMAWEELPLSQDELQDEQTIALKNAMSEPIDHDELLESFGSNLIGWQIWNNDRTTHWCGRLNEGTNLEILRGTRNLVEGMIQLNHTWFLLRLMLVLTMKSFCPLTSLAPWPEREMSELMKFALPAALGVEGTLRHWGMWACWERSSWLSSSKMISWIWNDLLIDLSKDVGCRLIV